MLFTDKTRIIKLIESMIGNGSTDGLKDKLDVFLLADRITMSDYQKFMGQLGQSQKEQST